MTIKIFESISILLFLNNIFSRFVIVFLKFLRVAPSHADMHAPHFFLWHMRIRLGGKAIDDGEWKGRKSTIIDSLLNAYVQLLATTHDKMNNPVYGVATFPLSPCAPCDGREFPFETPLPVRGDQFLELIGRQGFAEEKSLCLVTVYGT